MREPFLKRLSSRRNGDAPPRDEEPAAAPPVEAETRPSGLRDGIVVSTVVRMTTSDGQSFDDPEKALEHEAYYQILRQLVKDLGWSDSEESAAFARVLARCYRDLIPLLVDLEKHNEALRVRIRDYQRTM